jgi:hypothetical protein
MVDYFISFQDVQVLFRVRAIKVTGYLQCRQIATIGA